MRSTARLGLILLEGDRDPVASVDDANNTNAGILDNAVVRATGGTLPAAEFPGRVFETAEGGLFYDGGSRWVQLSTGPDPTHVVGAAGEPPFIDGWSAEGADGVRFWRDSHGLVHIRGAARTTGAISGSQFTLPVAYWPRTIHYFAGYGLNNSGRWPCIGQVVAANGRVSCFPAGAPVVSPNGPFVVYFATIFDPTR